MGRVTHFNISADDTSRAVKFYQTVFGWKAKKWPGPVDYWLVTTGPDDKPGINGGIGRREEPSDHTSNSVEVESLDEAVAKVAAAGGKVLEPRMPIPGVGWFAMCLDTEGSRFDVMEPDANAK
ncbi:MAG TPA: VOC family protein [Terriglobales bacterium]|nr:VOC family protein [Terriglobales bacterium]